MRIQAEGSLRASEDHQQRIRNLEQQLDAANQRIALEKAAATEYSKLCGLAYEESDARLKRAEAAERQLATAMDALKAHEEYCCSSEEQGREYFYNRFAQLKYKALAQIEQPQSPPNQPFPGDDPPSDACQCSACLALRRKARV